MWREPGAEPGTAEPISENEAHRSAVREGVAPTGAEPLGPRAGVGRQFELSVAGRGGGSVSGTRPWGLVAWLNLSGACRVSVQ